MRTSIILLKEYNKIEKKKKGPGSFVGTLLCIKEFCAI